MKGIHDKLIIEAKSNASCQLLTTQSFTSDDKREEGRIGRHLPSFASPFPF